MLSRLERQVAHALLTRPPLTRPRRVSSVRLECVMHAASVHPEPGSNSRLKSLYLSYLLFYCSHLGIVEISWLPSFLSFLVFCTFFRTFVLCTISQSLFNFQGSTAPRFVSSAANAWLLYHNRKKMSSTFFIFFEVFLWLCFLRIKAQNKPGYMCIFNNVFGAPLSNAIHYLFT